MLLSSLRWNKRGTDNWSLGGNRLRYMGYCQSPVSDAVEMPIKQNVFNFLVVQCLQRGIAVYGQVLAQARSQRVWYTGGQEWWLPYLKTLLVAPQAMR